MSPPWLSGSSRRRCIEESHAVRSAHHRRLPCRFAGVEPDARAGPDVHLRFRRCGRTEGRRRRSARRRFGQSVPHRACRRRRGGVDCGASACLRCAPLCGCGLSDLSRGEGLACATGSRRGQGGKGHVAGVPPRCAHQHPEPEGTRLRAGFPAAIRRSGARSGLVADPAARPAVRRREPAGELRLRIAGRGFFALAQALRRLCQQAGCTGLRRSCRKTGLEWRRRPWPNFQPRRAW